MSDPAQLHFQKPPPLYRNILYILMTAAWRRKQTLPVRTSPADVSVISGEFRISPKHLQTFCKLCRTNVGPATALIYPMTLVFPFLQRLLGLKEAPLPVFSVLAKYLRIDQHQEMNLDVPITVVCRYEHIRIVSNGLELDISASITNNGQLIWKAIETFFYRGEFDNATRSNPNKLFEPILESDDITRWPLVSGKGFRFARNCGDGNPLHYSKMYARLFGYQRDFAQPLLVLGRAVQDLAIADHQPRLSFDVAFKGPCYYENDILMHTKTDFNTQRFDVYSESNPRPCMTGSITFNDTA